MAALVNQTSLGIESGGPSKLPKDLQWYPFPGVQCPPPYYVLLQGVFAPLIIIISTILNSLIAVVLLQKHLRSPTNILLLAIALYDTLTGLFPFPAYIFVFTFRQCNDYIPYNYGWFHRINHDVLPFIFHTCSIWVISHLAGRVCRPSFVLLLSGHCRSRYSAVHLRLPFGESQTMVYRVHGPKSNRLCQCFSTCRRHPHVHRRQISCNTSSLLA